MQMDLCAFSEGAEKSVMNGLKFFWLSIAVLPTSCGVASTFGATLPASVASKATFLVENDRPFALSSFGSGQEPPQPADHEGESDGIVASAVPDHFKRYQSTVFGDHSCAVGAVTDEDGLYQNPYVYVSEGNGRRILWIRRLKYPAGFYQSRATHCLEHAGYLYVLLQTDTDSHAATNQTIVTVVKIDAGSGDVVNNVGVDVGDVNRAVSTWLSRDRDIFRVEGTKIIVSGRYRSNDSDVIEEFSTKVDL